MFIKRLAIYCGIFALLIPFSAIKAGEFDPNMVISDQELFDYRSMSKDAIQAFLDSRHSKLSDYKDVDSLTGRRSLASEIIFNSSQEYKINPRFTLVTLQKEQSLVEKQNPTRKNYDWATGYAVCDSCSMSDPGIQKHKGFAKQIDYAVGSARWWETNQSHGSFKKVGQKITIDGIKVTPLNYATGFLYTYTPHIHGNENFYKIWNRWFSKTYPNGTVVQIKGEDGVWLIEKGYRRPFVSKAALTSRFDPSQIVSIDESELLTYEESDPIKFPDYSLLRKPNGMVFLLRQDTVHYIISSETLRQLGYHPDEIIDITDEEYETFYQGKIISPADLYPMGAIFKSKENNTLYYIENGKRQAFAHADVAKILYPQLSAITVDFETLKNYPLSSQSLTFNEGTLVALPDSPLIYVISDGLRRHVPSEEVFEGLGYKWENIKRVSEQALISSPLGESVELNTTN